MTVIISKVLIAPGVTLEKIKPLSSVKRGCSRSLIERIDLDEGHALGGAGIVHDRGVSPGR
jgi:hypothetical protein